MASCMRWKSAGDSVACLSTEPNGVALLALDGGREAALGTRASGWR